MLFFAIKLTPSDKKALERSLLSQFKNSAWALVQQLADPEKFDQPIFSCFGHFLHSFTYLIIIAQKLNIFNE